MPRRLAFLGHCGSCKEWWSSFFGTFVSHIVQKNTERVEKCWGKDCSAFSCHFWSSKVSQVSHIKVQGQLESERYLWKGVCWLYKTFKYLILKIIQAVIFEVALKGPIHALSSWSPLLYRSLCFIFCNWVECESILVSLVYVHSFCV